MTLASDMAANMSHYFDGKEKTQPKQEEKTLYEYFLDGLQGKDRPGTWETLEPTVKMFREDSPPETEEKEETITKDIDLDPGQRLMAEFKKQGWVD